MNPPLPTPPAPGYDPIGDPTVRYANRIQETKLLVDLRRRGAKDIQVFVKTSADGSVRVQFRDKWKLRQWSMTPAACDALVAGLPATLSYDDLLVAIDAVPGVTRHHGKNRTFDVKKAAPAPAPGPTSERIA